MVGMYSSVYAEKLALGQSRLPGPGSTIPCEDSTGLQWAEGLSHALVARAVVVVVAALGFTITTAFLARGGFDDRPWVTPRSRARDFCLVLGVAAAGASGIAAAVLLDHRLNAANQLPRGTALPAFLYSRKHVLSSLSQPLFSAQ